MDKYEAFLQSKLKQHILSGFDIDESELNPMLFPFQKFIVQRALKAGKYAIFADCGLGKTPMQLEWAKQVWNKIKRPVLILAPLAVSGQTIHEGEKFGISVCKYPAISEDGITITNYEQLEHIDVKLFAGVVLDESGILKNFTGKTKQAIIAMFKLTPYKLCCTATPAPNDPMELGNHSEFLDAMSRNEMLAMYFVHDGGETAKWRLKGHSVSIFYNWVSQWAIMLNKPADIDFPMPGFDLPELTIIDSQVTAPLKDNGKLFNDAAVNAINFNQELRNTKLDRLELAAKIANETNEQCIIWVKHNDEGQILKKLIPDSVEVKGSDEPDYKENKLLGFAQNEFRVLITKTKIAQFGLNYQNCHKQIFASVDFSFEGLYQAIRRSYRFGQLNPVTIHIITTDTMQNVSESLSRKQKDFIKMQDEMSKAVNGTLHGYNLSKAVFDISEVKNDKYNIKRGDCLKLIKDVPDNSVGFSIFSPPFSELYTYSSHVEDMGNSEDYNGFIEHFSFLAKELFRVLKPGRNIAIHCMDLPIQKGKEGFIGLRDFSGMILRSFEDCGFIYHSRVTIWKDPVIEMQRTKALGLLHKQIKKDSTMSRVGIPDYLMIFRKDGERDEPVRCTIDVDLWQQYASPVWMDINYSDTLQFRNARDEQDEKHICPLQLPTIMRAITLYTNPGDTVLTPFMGIGSEVWQAVKMNRKGIGFELKESYYDMAKKNLALLVEELETPTLFGA